MTRMKNFEMYICLPKLNYAVENEDDNEEYKVKNPSTDFYHQLTR